jgi:hypothetical protein
MPVRHTSRDPARFRWICFALTAIPGRIVSSVKERSVILSVCKFLPRFLAFLILAAILTADAGCSSGGGIPVSGKVTVGDKPLTTGSVRYVPDKEKGNNGTEEPVGTINESSTYVLYTNGKPGAPAGHYKVAVVAQDNVDITNPTNIKSLIDPKYNTAEKTDLRVEVKSGGTYDLQLSGPGGAGGPTPGVPPMPK